MRDALLSTLFVIAVEAGLSYLAAMRGIEYVRRMAWLQVVLVVMVASHVTQPSIYVANLVGVYLSVLIGLAVADVEMNRGCKKTAMIASARDALSVMLSAAFLILPIIPAGRSNVNSFVVGAVLCVGYGVMYTLYHYCTRMASLLRSLVVVCAANVSVFAVTLNGDPISTSLLEVAMRVGVSLLVLSAVNMHAPMGSPAHRVIDL